MENTIFIVLLLAHLGIATIFLFSRSLIGFGFLLFAAIYILFIASLWFVETRVVITAWLILSVANMAIQSIYMKRLGVPKGYLAVLTASLLLWPVQLAAYVSGVESTKSTEEDNKIHREKIGTVPATVTGTVSFTYHIGSEEGEDMVWLEEYGDVEFFVSSAKDDDIGIEEGKIVSLTIEERETSSAGKVEGSLWVTGGALIGVPESD